MPTQKRHILFVEDDPDIQDLIRALVEPRGVRVSTAGDGAEALQMMKDGLRPDIIIADLELPHMDGLTLFQAIRANDDWISIPFIAMSGHRDKPIIRQALMLGVDDYLLKPIDEERLLLTIYNKAKRAQELTRYAKAAHEMLEYVRRDMARMFTHELRTPLVSLNMVTELLTQHTADLTADDAQELLDTLQAGVMRLNRLVEQMVLLIQLDTGELQKLIRVAAHPGPLWDALTPAVSQARTFSYRQRDIDVLYHPGDTGGEIMAEWRTLRHALAEILCNAMAFSPKDQPIIVAQSADSEQVTLSISDKGPGIPEDKQGTLFRRFQQVEREKHEQQGIGVGLYLARSIVEANGGELAIDSAEGQGTTVTVRFPLIGVGEH